MLPRHHRLKKLPVSYLLAHPEAETRIGQLSAPLTAVTQGNFTPLWRNTLAGLGEQLARVQHEVENGIKALHASAEAG